MKREIFIIYLLVTFFLLACKPSKYNDSEIFKHHDWGEEQLRTFDKLPKYSSNPKTFENKLLYGVVFDLDTIVLYKLLSNYLPMFSTGLITPRHFSSLPGEKVTIDKITEITNPKRSLKVRRYRIDYSTTYWLKGKLVHEMINATWAMVELTSSHVYKTSQFNEFVANSKLTFIMDEIDI
jgi:hypothetical protein